MKVVLLGSAPLLRQSGLGESLADRFELITLLLAALSVQDLAAALLNRDYWGRVVESAGATFSIARLVRE